MPGTLMKIAVARNNSVCLYCLTMLVLEITKTTTSVKLLFARLSSFNVQCSMQDHKIDVKAEVEYDPLLCFTVCKQTD